MKLPSATRLLQFCFREMPEGAATMWESIPPFALIAVPLGHDKMESVQGREALPPPKATFCAASDVESFMVHVTVRDASVFVTTEGSSPRPGGRRVRASNAQRRRRTPRAGLLTVLVLPRASMGVSDPFGPPLPARDPSPFACNPTGAGSGGGLIERTVLNGYSAGGRPGRTAAVEERMAVSGGTSTLSSRTRVGRPGGAGGVRNETRSAPPG